MINEERIVVIISWRSQPKRIDSFNRLVQWYKENYPNIELIISDSDTENFSLSRSRNLGAKEAISKGYKILIFSDADYFVEKKYLDLSINNSIKNNEITVPYSTWIQSKSEEENNMLLNKEYDLDKFTEIFHRPFILENKKINRLYPCSGNIVVPSNIYKKLNGFEEKINSWGPEDIVFHRNYIMTYKKPFRYTKGLGYTTHDYDDQRDNSLYNEIMIKLDNFVENYKFNDYIVSEYNKSLGV